MVKELRVANDAWSKFEASMVENGLHGCDKTYSVANRLTPKWEAIRWREISCCKVRLTAVRIVLVNTFISPFIQSEMKVNSFMSANETERVLF